MLNSISRRLFLSQCAAALAIAGTKTGTCAEHSGKQPNIVLILADDLGYGDIGCYGSPDIRTPHIDSIAQRGVRFTNFYANAPECTPTRTALLTGCYQQRVGGLECAIGVSNVGRYDDAIRLRETNDLGLPASWDTLPSLLKQAGYATAICGKWHLGYEEKFLPKHHGFDHFFGVLGGNIDYYFHAEASGLHTLVQNDRAIRRDGYLTDLLTDEAVQFIDKNKDNPFFLYVPYTAPHSPYQGPEDKPDPLLLLTEEEWNKGDHQTYVKMIESMDDGVGRILRSLEEQGLTENTLVIFMSDNGANNRGSNDPYRGYKSRMFEGGIHVPCVAQFPNVLPEGKTSDQVCITMDFTASLARIANAPDPKRQSFDGLDILRMAEEDRPAQDRKLYWRYRRGNRTSWAVRDGNWKFIRDLDGYQMEEYLFDLVRDPEESNNLLYENPQLAANLKDDIKKWEQEVKPER